MRKTKNNDEVKAKSEVRENFRRGLAAFEQAAIELERKNNASIEPILSLDGGEIEDLDVPVMNLKRAEVPPPPPPEKNKFNIDGMVDVVVFCEHPYFLNLRLTPWQKLILKVFYSGSPGNTHLKIEDEKTEDCSGCVWNYNRKFENKYFQSLLKQEESGKNNLMPPENSPCLTCVRFDPRVREARYNKLLDEAIRKEQLEEVEALKIRELVQMFQTEMDLLEDPQIDYKVRKQILDKFGRKFQELLLVLGRRSGKMLELSTPMLTTDGWKTMGTLQVGDYVFAPDGSPTKVKAKSEINYDEQAYELEFSNGEIIRAGASHEWKTLTKAQRKNASRGKYSKAPIEQIFTTEEIHHSLTCGKPRHLLKKGSLTERNDKPSKEFNHAIPVTKPLVYPNKNDLTMHPYLLGAWLGDGSKSTSAFTSIDDEITDYIVANCNHSIIQGTRTSTHWIQARNCDNTSFVNVLKEESVFNNKHIPRKYLEAPLEDRLELLRGLNDTNGFVDSKRKTIEFCSCNERLANDYYELVCGLGFKAVMKASDAKLYGRVTSTRYRITYSVPKDFKVFNLSRKQTVLDNRIHFKSDTQRIFIKRCDKIKNNGMQCIEVEHESHMYLAGRSLIPTHNSFITAVITLYEVYRFLMMGHPQDRYPIMEFDIITILNVAVSEGQAKMAIFDKIRQLAESSPYFVQSIGKSTQLEMFFLTDHDKEENKRRVERGQEPMVGTIQLKSGHSSASGMVGGTMAVIIIDEMAEMAPASAEGGTDDELYDKLKPAISTFGRDGKMICISNPLGPYGKFYKLYEDSFEDNMVLMAQLPTWLSNPYIEQSYLDQQKKKNPETYHVYYGAQFGSSGSDTWINEAHVKRAFEHIGRSRRAENGAPLTRYFAHLDPAKSSDYYTLVVCHAEPMESAIGPDGKPLQRIVVDHMHIWRPKGKNQPINSEEVDRYILQLATRFKFAQISYDQWNSQSSITKLINHSLNAVNKKFDMAYKASIYGELYELFSDGRIVFYNQDTVYESNGIVEELLEVTECKKQFFNLQRKFNGKSFKIEALPGFYDDFTDAVAAAAYEALKDKVYSTLPRTRTMMIRGRR